MSAALQPHGLYPARFLCLWDFLARTLEWVPFPFPRDLPDPGVEPMSLASPALADGFFTTSTIWEALREAKGL